MVKLNPLLVILFSLSLLIHHEQELVLFINLDGRIERLSHGSGNESGLEVAPIVVRNGVVLRAVDDEVPVVVDARGVVLAAVTGKVSRVPMD